VEAIHLMIQGKHLALRCHPQARGVVESASNGARGQVDGQAEGISQCSKLVVTQWSGIMQCRAGSSDEDLGIKASATDGRVPHGGEVR
jgi:hypothetical protein